MPALPPDTSLEELSDKPLVKSRIAEIQTMQDWREIEKLAEAVGITEKPKDESWADQAYAIAQAELEQGLLVEDPEAAEADEAITAPPASAAEAKKPKHQPAKPPLAPEPSASGPRYPTDFYKSAGIPTCSACGERELVNPVDNTPLCPEGRKQCPRLEGANG